MRWQRLQLISAIVGILLTVVLSFFLPERVATHFDISGQPNAWSSNLTNTLLFCGLFVFLLFLFAGIGLLLKKIPVSLINIPNREYWFTPERRESSVTRVKDFMAQFGFFTNIFIAGILFMTFYANRQGAPIPVIAMFAWLAVFLVFVVGWVVQLYRAFKLPGK